MNFIIGMDLGVFVAWIGTLLATLLCIIYGLYSVFMKKSEEKQPIVSSKDEEKKQGEDT